jgi:hypothetical protein
LLSRALSAANLELQAPDACPAVDSIREEVERLVGRPLSEVEAIDFHVEIRENGREWRVVVESVTRAEPRDSRARELKGASCAEVADAAAVAMAMAIHATEAPEAEPEVATPASTAAAAPAVNSDQTAPPVSAEPSHRASARAARSVTFGAGLYGALDAGALPQVTPGGELDAWVGVGALRVAALGAWFVPQEKRLADGTGGHFELVFGGVLLCAERPLGQFALRACGGGEFGQLSARGIGVAQSHSVDSPWRAARAEIITALALAGPLRGAAAIGASVPFVRRDFVLNQAEPVYQPASVGGRGWIGLELSF